MRSVDTSSALDAARSASDAFRASRERLERLAGDTAQRMQRLQKFLGVRGEVTPAAFELIGQTSDLLHAAAESRTAGRKEIAAALVEARRSLDEILRELGSAVEP